MCGFLTLKSLNYNNPELFNISGFSRVNNNNILSSMSYIYFCFYFWIFFWIFIWIFILDLVFCLAFFSIFRFSFWLCISQKNGFPKMDSKNPTIFLKNWLNYCIYIWTLHALKHVAVTTLNVLRCTHYC